MDDSDTEFYLIKGDDVRDFNEANILPKSPQKLDEIRKWLDPTDYMLPGNEYKKHLDSHLAGTGDWLMESEKYQRWRDTDDCGILWIKAVPGAGKSVCAAATANRLSESGVPVLFFFFRQIVGSNDNPRSLVKDWLAQVLVFSPKLQQTYDDLLASGVKIDSITTDQLWNHLCDALDLLPKVYCVADALDEVDTAHEEFLPRLAELGRRQPKRIKILMTSRPIPYLDEIFKPYSIPQLRLGQELTDGDVRLFVRTRLADIQSNIPIDAARQLQERIFDKSKGLFLYARLLLDGIQEKIAHKTIDVQSLHDASLDIPDGLKALYTQLLLETSIRSGVSQEKQITILGWVTHAIRPLRLLELASLLGFTEESGRTMKDNKALVRASCGRLLEILPDETVSVIHHSFTEYLRDVSREQDSNAFGFPVLSSADIHQRMAMTCLRYLQSGILAQFTTKDVVTVHSCWVESNVQDLRQQHHLLDYALAHWQDHARKSRIDNLIIESLDGFLVPQNQPFSAWAFVKWPYKMRWHRFEKVTSLHVAAQYGLTEYLQAIISRSVDCNVKDNSGNQPLSYGARSGHIEVCRILLRHGADPSQLDGEFCTALHRAVMFNHCSVVKILLEHGMNPNIPRPKTYKHDFEQHTTQQETPMHLACRSGFTDIIVEFMKCLHPDQLHQALLIACQDQHIEAVDTLLGNQNIDVNILTNNASPLYVAANGKSVAIVEKLLKRGADPNQRMPERETYSQRTRFTAKRRVSGRSPMHAAAGYSNHCMDILDLLVAYGGDINAQDNEGWTPLHSACNDAFYDCDAGFVEYLLNAGADATAATNCGQTPLHVMHGVNVDIVELLINHGADVNARTSDDHGYQTPLHMINPGDDIQVLRHLLKRGADYDAGDGEGNTPLHIALISNTAAREQIKAYLEAGADPNKKNHAGLTPIFMHRKDRLTWGNQHFDLLSAAGTDFNALDPEGSTALFHFMDCGSYRRETCEKLIELGTSAKIVNKYGENILHVFARSGKMKLKLMKVFLDAGADPLVVDCDGNTVLHHAALGCPDGFGSDHIGCLDIFISKGVSITARNRKGQTALHIAAGVNAVSEPLRNPNNSFALFIERDGKEKPVIDDHDEDGLRPIHFAAAVSQHNVFRLWKAGADMTARTHEGLSALHIAARSRQIDIVALLVSIYESSGNQHMINLKDSVGRTALHYACRSGRRESVRILLKASSDATCIDDDKNTMLHLLAESKVEDGLWLRSKNKKKGRIDWDAAGMLLRDECRPYNCSTSKKHDIHLEYGCIDIVRTLLEAGIDLEAKNSNGLTAIHLCQSSNQPCSEMETAIIYNLPHRFQKLSLTSLPLQLPWNSVEDCATSPLPSGRPRYREIFDEILHSQDERVFDEFLRIYGDDFLTPGDPDDGDETLLHILAKWGYASHILKFAEHWRKTKDLPDWNAEPQPGQADWRKKSLLLLAYEREVSSLETFKALVGALGFPSDMVYRYKNDYQGVKWYDECTILHRLARAARWSDIETLEYLLSFKPNLELKDRYGLTPLHVAIAPRPSYDGSGLWKDEAIELLLEHGADPNHLDQNGSTCLHKASLSLVPRLLECGADVSLGRTSPLIAAICRNEVDLVRIFLEQGVDVNGGMDTNPPFSEKAFNVTKEETWRRFKFPFHHAACLSDPEPILRLLLEHGAEPLAKYDYGSTIVHELVKGHNNIVPYFNIVKPDLEMRDVEGKTLLLAAASRFTEMSEHQRKDYPDAVSFLVGEGADLEAIDEKGRNVLHFFCCTSSDGKKLIEQIISKAPHLVNQRDKECQTPLHYTFSKLEVWRIKTLLAAGADPFLPDKSGDTIIHPFTANMARRGGNEDFLELFVEILQKDPSKINAKNNEGETPIFGFISTVRWVGIDEVQEIFSILQEHLAVDLHVRNNAGETLLHAVAKASDGRFATGDGIIWLFQKLVECGLDPLAEDAMQRTALDVAAASKATKILELFKKDGKVGGVGADI